MMHDYYWNHGGSGGMLFHSGFWVLVLLLLAVGVLLWFRSGKSRAGDGEDASALELLDRRYARGEIEREEYLQRKKDLLAAPE